MVDTQMGMWVDPGVAFHLNCKGTRLAYASNLEPKHLRRRITSGRELVSSEMNT